MITSAMDAAPRTRQGYLAGPSRRLDPRINAVRVDLADIMLAGDVIAPRYSDGVVMRTVVASTMLRGSPDDASPAVSALLFGEEFKVFDIAHGWAWGQCRDDFYVGWARITALGAGGGAPSHRVSVPTGTIFSAPDIKSRVIGTLPLNARVAATPAGDAFLAGAGGYIHRRHVTDIEGCGVDPVALALGFIGTPYVWGGRARDGIDCSGLTQAVLRAGGTPCPRDTDQQGDAFGAVAAAERRRGDLVMFPGHVGILADPLTLIHANAFWMATVVEPLAHAAARLAPSGYRRPRPD